ncbi:TIGR01777 family oxidoreductase [cf. Phormidesmis sp. LEGE 11477]|uniref:thylakoid membrane protein ThyD n=1 Tax=cf. Phormidesmis sp. LEGE 11477 TaxID=1828680 RepID=UPI001882A80D|nr:TIGR01777 family oxidoreductase [cf. Phormidesmis sp. LEGE 11477]MBE9064083.1 TIGR01777 family protein [cf. Phormidesmis sp. LEGE 11477]
MKIAITGATGFVGSRLVERLIDEGHDVKVFTRSVAKAKKIFTASKFNPVGYVAYTPLQSGDWQSEISGCEGVANLAGEPISERWSDERKKRILNSRKIGTEKLVEAIAKAEQKPSVLVSGSAIGYYGTSETAEFFETSTPAENDFLSQVCQAWEAEADKAKDTGVRVAIIRTGIVLGDGGAIAKMITPFKLYAGGPIGSGQQWFSWIHIDDLVSLFLKALLDSSMHGIYNGTAPEPVRMKDLAQTLGEVMDRPSWLPVPDFAIEALLGDGAVVVLKGQKVLPERTQAAGFSFDYSEPKEALADVVKRIG